jgi:hypothetical protein
LSRSIKVARLIHNQIRNGIAAIGGSRESVQDGFLASRVQLENYAVARRIHAVGGGNLSQNDAIWGLNAGSEIFQYNFSSGKLIQVLGGPFVWPADREQFSLLVSSGAITAGGPARWARYWSTEVVPPESDGI